MFILLHGELFFITTCTIKKLIITPAFIRIITFHKAGSGSLLEATDFDNTWKNLKIFKFSSDDPYIDIGNGSVALQQTC